MSIGGVELAPATGGGLEFLDAGGDIAAPVRKKTEGAGPVSAWLVIGCIVFVALIVVVVIVAAMSDNSSKSSGNTATSAATDSADASTSADAAAAAAPAPTPSPNTSPARDVADPQCAPPDATLASCTAVIAANRDTAWQISDAYIVRGNIYYTNKDYDRTIDDYSKSIAIDHDENIYRGRGNVYAARAADGDYERAISDYDKAIALKPDDPQALYARGIAKQNHGDSDAGTSDIAAAKKLDPTVGGEVKS